MQMRIDDQVRSQVRDFVLTNFLFADASRMPVDTDSLLGAGIVDSTGVLELVEFLEGEMGITVADDETVPVNLDSIENLTRFVLRKRAGASD